MALYSFQPFFRIFSPFVSERWFASTRGIVRDQGHDDARVCPLHLEGGASGERGRDRRGR